MTAPYPLLRTPLPGYIMPKGSSWSGGTFGVTSTLADHRAAGRASGTDIARYPRASGDPVYLMRDAVMYEDYTQPYHNPPQIGDGAKIRRFMSKEGDHGYAHLGTLTALVKGRLYPAGTKIGTVGASGTKANSPHLHYHWRDKNLVHREVYLQMEQSRNMQFNAGVVGVNIRTAPGLSGAVWGSCQAAGIVRKSDGKVVASRNAILTRRHVVAVSKDGYTWMPITVPGQSAALWTAKPFIHFV